MTTAHLFPAILVGCTLLASTPVSTAAEWYGSVALQSRLFDKRAGTAGQSEALWSLAFEPTMVHEWNDGADVFAFTPFIRVDDQDAERSQADVRELTWIHVGENWETRVGLRKVLWGVTESTHLVDVINQTDTVENVDGEDKLGQPMINVSWVRDWGIVDFFVLPYFRERTFPAVDGRPRTLLPVAVDRAQYESSDKERHIDYALRWVHSLGDWDVGLSWFKGTNRDPVLQTGLDSNGQPALIPLYEQMEQFGIDLQATKGDWLWKLEIVDRDSTSAKYTAAAGGFEYTLVGIFDSVADLGVLAEYIYDERDDNAPTSLQDDILLGMRWTRNDAQSTEALIGIILDRGHNGKLLSLEASRRLGQNWKLTLEARWFVDLPTNDPLYPNRDDDVIQLELGWYF